MHDIVNLGDIVRRDPAEHLELSDVRDEARTRRLSLADLRAQIQAVARGLLRRGCVAGDRIAVMSANRWEFLATYFGAMSAGMVAVPVNHRLPRETIAFIVADAGACVALVDDGRDALLPDGFPRIRFDADSQEHDSFAALLDHGEFESVIPAPDACAEILYTSGSTGRPKGVPLTHAGQLWALRKWHTGGDAALGEKTLIVAPLYHMNGLFFASVAVSNGIAFTLMPRFDARRYLQLAATERATLLSGIPTMFALMAREGDLVASLDLSSVRTVTIGSAPLTDALLDCVRALFPNAVCQNGYGTTEAGPAVFGAHPDGRARPSLALGVPYSDVGVRLAPASTPDVGVLQVRTPALTPGYLNLPDVTAERMVDGWYDTGDVMRRDADGFYYFVGRADDMFVCGGENVYPGEVERLLERCPGIAQAAVVPVPDEIKGMIPVAFVVRSAGSTLDEDTVKAFTLREGPAYAHPRIVIFRAEIPVASTHKVDRTALLNDALYRAADAGRGAR